VEEAPSTGDGDQVMVTETAIGDGSIRFLEARHQARPCRRPHPLWRGHRVGRFPSRIFAVGVASLELAQTAIDPLTWTQQLVLDGELAVAEPKLSYRPLHVAAPITRTASRTGSHPRRLGMGRPGRRRLQVRLGALPRRPPSQPSTRNLTEDPGHRVPSPQPIGQPHWPARTATARRPRVSCRRITLVGIARGKAS
jgi:hypothetical protein